MTGWRRVLRDTVALAIAFLAYFLLPVQVDLLHGEFGRGLVSIALIVLVGAVVLWQVMLQIDDPGRRVDGLLLSMVCGVLVFALAYYRLALEDPGQLVGLSTRIDALYFTMTTLLTVGFGDIHAEGQLARVVVVLQMVFNIAVIATAASSLSSRVRERALQRSEARRAAHEGEG